MFNRVEIEINHGCNLACSYCPNSKYERVEKGVMEISLYKKIMKQLKEINYKDIISYHFYNEPLTCPDLYEKISLTKQYLPNCIIEIYSNGIGLDKNKLHEMINLGVDKFVITKHERFNDTDFPFEKLLNELNENVLDKIVYKKWTQINLTNRGGCLKELSTKGVGDLPCFIPMKIMTITVKGNVIPCFEHFFQPIVFGNVRETNLFDIWNSHDYKKFRSNLALGMRHKYEVCNACDRTEVLL